MMSGGGQFKTLRERVDRIEGVLSDGSLISTMRNVVILLELVGDLTDRVAALDGGPGIEEAYSKKLAKRSAGDPREPPKRGGTH